MAIVCVSSSRFSAARNRVAVLNALRDEINANYGFDENRFPRINCGPCARFALLFRDQWKTRFAQQLNITCVMTPDRAACGHVVLKFPDGSYFDGGNGVVSEQQLRVMFPKSPIEEMVHFDLPLLDKLVGGLNHKHYPICPNYSDTLTGELIEKHLSRLPTSANWYVAAHWLGIRRIQRPPLLLLARRFGMIPRHSGSLALTD